MRRHVIVRRYHILATLFNRVPNESQMYALCRMRLRV
jgi:hypothetical protein